VKVLNRKEETAKEVGGNFSAEKGHLTNDIKHFLPLDVFHEEVNMLFVVEGLGETHNIGEDNFGQNPFFLNDTFLHSFFSDRLL
jgi:hypothetical protein